MNDLMKYIGSGVAGIVLTAAVFLFGGGSDQSAAPPQDAAPKALAGNVECPRPPRTGGAIFVVFDKGHIVAEGGQSGKVVQALNCDYNGEWSYTIDADGRETLQKYNGAGSPIIFDREDTINRALADIN